jgi:superfamily II DNA or RNA helicase/CRISPR/Cas system-associated exonuclease Cas4 (RecB family)
MKFNISASSLALYEESPFRFFHRYILGTEPDTVVNSSYGKAGNILHETIEEYCKHKDREKALHYFEHEWMRWESMLLDFNGKPLSESSYKDMAIKGMDLVDKEYTVHATEEKFVFPFYKEVNIKGYIDLTAKEGDDFVVVDWKSNSRTSNFSTHAKMYAYLIYRKYGKVPRKLVYEYLKLDKTVEYHFTEREVKEFEQYLYVVVKRIENDKDHPERWELGEWNSPFNDIKKLCQEASITKNMAHYIAGMIRDNKILITSELPKELIRFIDHCFSYKMKNSHFIPSVESGKWDGVVRFLKTTRDGFITLPLPYINQLQRVFDAWNQKHNTNYKLNLTDLRNEKVLGAKYKTEFAESDIVLRDYQLEAVDKAIEKKFMTIKLPPSSGKTIISSEIIKRLNRRTLFICNRIELLNQTIETYEEALGVKIGLVSEGEMDVSNQITLSTIQSIYAILKRKDDTSKKLKNYLFNVNVTIIDETHIVGNTAWWDVLGKNLLNIEYCIGLSATPFRSEGTLHQNAVTGFVEYEKKKKEMQEEGYLCRTKSLFVEMPPPHNALECEDFHENYNQFIVQHEKRNNFIADFVKRHDDKKIIVVVSRIEHGEILNALIPNSYFLNGSTPKKERVKKMKEFKNNKNPFVLISMTSIVSTGLNIVDLSILINASANRSGSLTIQQEGRVARCFEGKDMGYYISFKDKGLFNVAYQEQIKILKEYESDIGMLNVDEVLA